MEKIEKYIERFFSKTKRNKNYEMKFSELEQGINEAIAVVDTNGAFKIVATFFNYGYAKGYRAAMAEMKKGGAV